MIIVTSGNRYIDIDAYAGCIAYAYLLNLKGIEAKAVSTAKINESITTNLLNLETKLDKYKESHNNQFVIIDVSNKDYFDDIVNENKIVFGQLVVWDKKYILDNEKVLYDTLSNIGEDWMFNLICLKDEKSYIISNDLEIKKKLEKLLNATFKSDIMELQEVWLRKEIIARALKI